MSPLPRLVLSEDHPLRLTFTLPTRRRRSTTTTTTSSSSTPLKQKLKQCSDSATRLLFWIYDEQWLYVVWFSVVILFLSIMGWICECFFCIFLAMARHDASELD